MKISEFRLTITSRESIGFNWSLVKSLSHQSKHTQVSLNRKEALQKIVDEEDANGFVDYQGNNDNVEDVEDPRMEKWIQKGIFGYSLPGKLQLAPISLNKIIQFLSFFNLIRSKIFSNIKGPDHDLIQILAIADHCIGNNY
jgi:hypothetical protein